MPEPIMFKVFSVIIVTTAVLMKKILFFKKLRTMNNITYTLKSFIAVCEFTSSRILI